MGSSMTMCPLKKEVGTILVSPSKVISTKDVK